MNTTQGCKGSGPNINTTPGCKDSGSRTYREQRGIMAQGQCYIEAQGKERI